MKWLASKARLLTKLTTAILSIGVAHSVHSLELSQSPLFLAQPVKPLVMLNMSNDHQLYFKAYDDYTDINDDDKGIADTTYMNTYDYYGYFDSSKCYSYESGVFNPKSITTDHRCTTVGGGDWSGNFLNWVSMTRMDAVRKILYGGKRKSDTATETILERAYIPSDAHAFAKYYGGSDLADFTPFTYTSDASNPEKQGITFCNVTYAEKGLSQNIDEPPLIRAKLGNYSLWASNQAFQCMWSNSGGTKFDLLSDYGMDSYVGAPSKPAISTDGGEYYARVKVCDSSVGLEENCRSYPSGNSKPTGLLQKYGEKDEIHFGLITGSYDKNKSGGVLRKNIGSLANEIAVATDGTFVNPVDSGSIIGTLNKLRISRYDHESGQYVSSDSCNWGLASFPDGDCSNWGNPQSEIYLESLKYLAGESATAAFLADDSGYIPNLSRRDWVKPVDSTNYCAATSIIQFNASTSSYDNDQLGGATLVSTTDIESWTNKIGDAEKIHNGSYFVGEASNSEKNQLCTAKTVGSLSAVQGTCPDAPRLEGSYNLAGLAYYARANDIQSSLTGVQNVTTYGVALAPAVPKVEVPTDAGKVTILPACRNKSTRLYSEWGEGAVEHGNCAIVDFKILQQSADGKSGTLYVNWEDSEQGGDYDLDMWGIIAYSAMGDSISVTTRVMAQAASHVIGFGYVISGTEDDGFHVKSGINNFTYPGTDCTASGDCTCLADGNDGTGGNGICINAKSGTKTFKVGGSSAKLLEQPLYYAAKWGGYSDSEDGVAPSVDAIAAGGAENYFYAIEPSELEENLGEALERVASAAGSASSVAANSTRLGTDTVIYQALFDSSDWHGELKALKLITKTIEKDDGTLEKVTTIGDEVWSTSDASFTPLASRKVFTYSKGDGAVFAWDQLSDAQKQALMGEGSTDEEAGKAVLNWVRGSDQEGLRDRETLLGDIVNSSPVFAGRKNYNFQLLPDTMGGHKYQAYMATKLTRKEVVYVGANDGMLHAFDASSGKELFAYVPSGVYSKLKDLASPNYGTGSNPHKYNVDGPLFVGDAYVGGEWKNILVGTLGAGGRGVFALDVTDPTSFDEDDILFELSETDFSGALGNVLEQPVIAPTEDGWKLFFGNGYNSSEEKARLFVVDLVNPLTASDVVEASTAGSNGLSGAALLTDGTGAVVAAYGGDLLGNMWKFEAGKSGNDIEWQVALSGSPLFTAKYPSADPNVADQVQPITATPTLGLNRSKQNAIMVYFGTGSYLTGADNSAVGVNSVYAIADQGSAVSSRSNLMQKTISESGDTRVVQNNDDTSWWASKDGWYMDFSTAAGERVTSKPLLEHDRLLFPTLIPSTDPCAFGGSGWMMEIIAVGDQDNTHSIFGEDGAKTEYAIIGYSGVIRDRDRIILTTNDIKGNPDAHDGDAPPDAIGRMSWRQLR
ncbi:PilC/PilY family type IV pilus protein [Microbulbifer sp. CAU 1566]|uniref:pilus assembly protein n=1 Tax=Microbulbifer sp. CAU 1566 TaxID=2933269 RepID=UPI002003A398|nr:PilC/PilY family type IV pilus protein [Microbulbifer sp. CAU 1566]MCK7598785.1 PilC/PilY family type IV pilus protein [Microbulbifer sp. CAU 1566]